MTSATLPLGGFIVIFVGIGLGGTGGTVLIVLGAVIAVLWLLELHDSERKAVARHRQRVEWQKAFEREERAQEARARQASALDDFGGAGIDHDGGR